MTNNHYTIQSFSADQLGLSPDKINKHVLSILAKLQEAGFDAYIVGGGVRDLLVGQDPKDFDIATNALPEQIRRLFRNSRLIGRRFRLAHIYFGNDIIEVATFRAAPSTAEQHAHHLHADTGMIINDNIYGSIEEDAWRRDFTINALYYDPCHQIIIDYTNGLADLKLKTLRLIGEPLARYREDPVRMLRAIRLATKLDFDIHQATEQTIHELKELLQQIPAARLFEEFRKLFLSGKGFATYQALAKFDVFKLLFPKLNQQMQEDPLNQRLIESALQNTDQRIQEDRPVTPAFILAAFLWPDYLAELSILKSTKIPLMTAQQQASQKSIKSQIKHITIPKRLSSMMEEIWFLQRTLETVTQQTVYKIYENRRFRAAYDFLLLRVQAGEVDLAEKTQWWTTFQEYDDEARLLLIEKLPKAVRKKRKRKKKV